MQPRSRPRRPRLAAAIFLALAGCVGPPGAAVFTKMSGPIAVASGEPAPLDAKRGKAHAHVFLGLFGYGDASLEAAMLAGGITRVHHVDYEYKAFLGLFSKYTTVVVGE